MDSIRSNSQDGSGEPASSHSCGCSRGEGCGFSRREFLVAGGLGSAAALLGASRASGSNAVAATPHQPAPARHPVPANKELPAGWLRSLRERGERTAWRGEDLKTIGMPVGGIGAGQLYLCGDGTLGQWEIFNEHEFIGFGLKNYAKRSIPKPVDHGLAIVCEVGGKPLGRVLDETGFADISFRGEYPIGVIRYSDPEFPVSVTMEVFSPFIPLNAGDSALPATLFELTLTNTSTSSVKAGVVGWLENPVARRAADAGWKGRRITKVHRGNGQVRIAQSAEPAPEDGKSKPAPRAPVVFADFEGPTYGPWKATGTAFGAGPGSGGFPNQQPVIGFAGKGLANSFVGGDDARGTLLSPPFTVSRRHINFLIGGGNKPDAVGIRLLVDGSAVRTATGRNSETLKWQTWNVEELDGLEARIEIFDNAEGPWGHVLVDHIEFSDQPREDEGFERLEQFPDSGTLVWACLADGLPPDEAKRVAAALPEELQTRLKFDPWTSATLKESRTTAFCTNPVAIAPGATLNAACVLAWHFPNSVKPDREAGHEYAARFANADAVADYVAEHHARLAADTRAWRDTWYDSTLPVWLLDRLHLTVCCLATGTCQWWKNGRFWAFEGVVCCEGTCTHVWNYAQSLARLFPELERSVRERQDLGVALLPSGLVGFRHNGVYAADGQCGTVLKAWREHLMSADDQFLRRNWPAIRKALEFSIQQDGNSDGLIENAQHNTYDIDFHGPNTFVGALYLAALRAGEQMAREMGDEAFAKRVHGIFESGKRLTEEKLWNGEYFVQIVDLKMHPKDQYGAGCLSDQLFGQNWAHQTGLGYLYSRDKVRKALESVWKYNWAPDTGIYNRVHPAERPFTDPTEAGLFICTWPESPYLKDGVRYREEVWTGIEYQVAAHMIYEGMVEEGLAICRAVHDRYQPSRRNPYNEVECSDFYARAMASWGVFLALSGFEYHGPAGRLGFAPRVSPEDFRCAFTAAEGWGSFGQKLSDGHAEWTICVRHGQLALSCLDLTPAATATTGKAKVVLDGASVVAECRVKDGKLSLSFPQKIVIKTGQTLRVDLA